MTRQGDQPGRPATPALIDAVPEATAPMPLLPFARLIALLAVVYPVLLLYGSLFPLSGWISTGVSPLAFLRAPFPRYWTALDLFANLALYAPLGAFWALFLLGRVPWRRVWWLALLPAVALSLGVEIAQNWLPSRVSSNVDLACNALGAALGVMLAPRLALQLLKKLHAACERWLVLDASGELGFLLLVLWFVGQWVPDGVAFTSGDWRGVWTSWPPAWAPTFGESAAVHLESVAVAAYVLAVGLILRELLLGSRRQGLAVALLFFLSAATGRAIAVALIVSMATAFDWLTFGAESGLAVGGGLLTLAYFVSSRLRPWLALSALMCGTLAINLAKSNPYAHSQLPPGSGSAFYNFAGLTELIALFWPLAAMLWWISRLRRSPIMAG